MTSQVNQMRGVKKEFFSDCAILASFKRVDRPCLSITAGCCIDDFSNGNQDKTIFYLLIL